MEYGCASCGVTFNLLNKGYLYVKGSREIPRIFSQAMPFRKGYAISFSSEAKLIELVETLLSSIGEEILEGNIMPSLNQYFPVYPLGEIAVRIQNYKIVDMIQSTDFTSFFQPIISLKDDRVFAYESLLRDPKGRISPGDLFEVAHNAGMHSLLDQKARETAIRTRSAKIQDGIKSFINFLPSTIYNPEFCLKHTFHNVKKYNVNPDDLVFEVVETEKIIDIDHLKEIFRVYKREGIQVALDDFGSGHSTLDVLIRLVPDYVKVDRSKIMYCDQDAENQEYLRELVRISKELDIAVLAEGIERQEELAFCRDIGMNLAQGYFLGRPQSEPEIFSSSMV
jgi:EAL domain-containing protein (putative c-di-GMP-specific phosphodiesterase class I)